MKQLPPNPTEGLMNLFPILVSAPIHFLISSTSPPIFSTNSPILLILEILWAKKQFETSLLNSDVMVEVLIIFYEGTWGWSKASLSMISSLFEEPYTILSGYKRSCTVVPSAKNSGLLITTNLSLLDSIVWFYRKISETALWVNTGTVDF